MVPANVRTDRNEARGRAAADAGTFDFQIRCIVEARESDDDALQAGQDLVRVAAHQWPRVAALPARLRARVVVRPAAALGIAARRGAVNLQMIENVAAPDARTHHRFARPAA
jgi:urease accessory protein UreF